MDNVPLLGQQVRVATPLSALPRKLDPDGTLKPAQVVQGPNGPQPLLGRDQFVDAEDLVDMIRLVVRHELEQVLQAVFTDQVAISIQKSRKTRRA